MKEPPQYKIGPDGGLHLTEEWKEWRTKHMSEGFAKHNAAKKRKKDYATPKKVTAENHHFVWKVIAHTPGSDRRVYFCTCRSGTGVPFASCGAVAIQESRNALMNVVVPPRFE